MDVKAETFFCNKKMTNESQNELKERLNIICFY